MSAMEVSLRLIDDGVQFHTESASRPGECIIFDFPPPLGKNCGYTGLEGLVMSFCGCVSTAVVALLRRTGKELAGMRCTPKASGVTIRLHWKR